MPPTKPVKDMPKTVKIGGKVWKVLKRLGAGGFGVVFLVKRSKEGLRALKIINLLSLGHFPELKVAKIIRHKYLVKVYATKKDGKKAYILMDYYPLGDLDHWLANTNTVVSETLAKCIAK